MKTPNLDRLAEDGFLFEKSYVANPVCGPNRACMFTGQYPKSHGLRENGNTLPVDAVTLPRVLAQAGYQTFSSGKLHLAPFGVEADSDVPDFEKTESNKLWNREGTEPIRLPSYGLQKVFYVGGHGHYNSGHHKRELQLRHAEIWEGYARDGAGELSHVDEEVWCANVPEELHYNAGRVVDKPAKQRLMEDTTVVFFTDHGDCMGDHGLLRKALLPYDTEWRIPTIWKIAGQKKRWTTEALHSTVDIMPTLLELADVEIPVEVQDISQASVLNGEVQSARRNC